MSISRAVLASALALLAVAALSANANAHKTQAAAGAFQVGVGSADITGTVAEVGFMGYAMLAQKGAGLHIRSRARAFLFIDPATGVRQLFVNLDICMTFQDMVQDVLKGLEEKYPGVYTYQNVMISSTHTHSTSAGYSRRVLYEVASLGFYKDNFEAVVNGVIAAVVEAHENVVDNARISIATGTLDGANINRSPASYDNDPASEKSHYAFNTDHDVTMLRFEDDDNNGKEFAALVWFAVHGTSMNNTNELFSADNKGFAEQVFERWMNGPEYLAGRGPFIAAFAQSNEGDVSPNTRGPHCPDGSPCDYVHSTCGSNNDTLTCIATGPGATDFESCQIIGQKQADQALARWQNASAWTPIASGLGAVHQFVDMSSVTVPANWTTTGLVGSTCAAALGYAFAGGTTDGPGDFPFEQGTTNKTDNPFWAWVTSFLGKPSAEQTACQDPKPILLDVSIYEPFPWVDQILPVQIWRLGQLYVIGVPGEFTTMSGRRLRDTVRKALTDSGVPAEGLHVVIAGLSNSYSHYVTTWEEYQIQRYEGASTLFGPHTLAAYQMLYHSVAVALATGQTLPPGPTPPDLTNKTFSLIAPVIVDVAPAGKTFGSIITDVEASYSGVSTGNVTVSCVFAGANPRNNLMTGDTFLTVEQQVGGNSWQVVVEDADWSTKMLWSRRGTVAESYITIEWNVPADQAAGTYRIGHKGYFKEVVATFPYSGYSSTFTISV